MIWRPRFLFWKDFPWHGPYTCISMLLYILEISKLDQTAVSFRFISQPYPSHLVPGKQHNLGAWQGVTVTRRSYPAFFLHFRFAALGSVCWSPLVTLLCGPEWDLLGTLTRRKAFALRNSSVAFCVGMLTNEQAAVNRGKIKMKRNDQWTLGSLVFSCVGIFWHSTFQCGILQFTN